ncbi:MAG TPA: DUF1569 domain-containing protein [Terriglobales bacterium]
MSAANIVRMRRKSLADSQDREEIIARIRSIRPEASRRWGKMNAHQMICHLADSFRVTIGEKKVSPAPRAHGLKLMKWLALQLPTPWPHGVKTRPEVDQQLGGTAPTTFDLDRDELMRLFQRFTHQPRDFEWQPHPMFGHMADAEWMRWGYLHTDHHLRQFGM